MVSTSLAAFFPEEYPSMDGMPVGPELPRFDFGKLDVVQTPAEVPVKNTFPQIPMPDFASMVISHIPISENSAPYHSFSPWDIVGRQPNSLL